jgi:hypothetical protein
MDGHRRAGQIGIAVPGNHQLDGTGHRSPARFFGGRLLPTGGGLAGPADMTSSCAPPRPSLFLPPPKRTPTAWWTSASPWRIWSWPPCPWVWAPAGQDLLRGAMLATPELVESMGLPEGHTWFFPMMIGYPKFKYHRLPERRAPVIRWK